MKRGGHGLATEQQVMKNLSSLIWPGQHGVVYVLLIPDKVILKWKVKGKVGKSCPTLWDPTDYRVHGILQARILEWVASPFSRGSSQPRDRTNVSHIAGKFFTSWATREAQEKWSGWPIPFPRDLPTQELNQGLLHCRWILYQMSYQRVFLNKKANFQFTGKTNASNFKEHF